MSRRSESDRDSGNRPIAATFLESLAARGRTSEHASAMRALELPEAGLAGTDNWLPDDVLGRMFVAADADPSFVRSVGHRLMAPDARGFALYRLGLATPEKTYRRVQALLPRDRATSSWVACEIASGSAQLEYHDHRADDALAGRAKGRGEEALCALRVGMLEAVPGLFGLLPARVKESTCISQGADACRYVVEWQRSSTTGLALGSGIGLLFAAGFLFASLALEPGVFPIGASAWFSLSSFGLAITLGRTFDLHRQLEAVAGARRGHLALFDQVDDALASKLDALARVDAKLEDDESGFRVDRFDSDSNDDSWGPAMAGREIRATAQKIHTTAGDLECWFEENAAGEIELEKDALVEGREFVREIRGCAAKLAAEGEAEDWRSRDPIDFVALVRRAIAAARPMLPPTTLIKLTCDEDLVRIVCEPVQIEQVVVQLLRNAVEASRTLSDSPEVDVSVRRMACGIELAVEDRGVGIEPSLLDEVFDPFFSERRAGVDEGFGLPVCLRIVERHGGELRIEVEDRPGTRVSILLPSSDESDESDAPDESNESDG